MPLRLNVGVSRKIGLPDYSSIGASCNLELELESGLLQNDLDGLHVQIRGAYVAAHQAVNDELARLQVQAAPALAAPAPSSCAPGRGDGAETAQNGAMKATTCATPARSGSGRGRPPKPATANQVRAIVTIARSQHADLEGLLRDEYGVARPEELSLADASRFIDQLKAASQV